jgi:hypothetical protein
MAKRWYIIYAYSNFENKVVDSRAMTTASLLEDIMRLSFRTIAVSTLTLMVSSTLATAAEVRVLSVGSTQIAAKAIAAEFETQTGHKVIFTIRPPFNIDKGSRRRRSTPSSFRCRQWTVTTKPATSCR